RMRPAAPAKVRSARTSIRSLIRSLEVTEMRAASRQGRAGQTAYLAKGMLTVCRESGARALGGQLPQSSPRTRRSAGTALTDVSLTDCHTPGTVADPPCWPGRLP